MHCKKQDISEADFLFVWAMGLLGVATCLAAKTTDEFESHMVHQEQDLRLLIINSESITNTRDDKWTSESYVLCT